MQEGADNEIKSVLNEHSLQLESLTFSLVMCLLHCKQTKWRNYGDARHVVLVTLFHIYSDLCCWLEFVTLTTCSITLAVTWCQIMVGWGGYLME